MKKILLFLLTAIFVVVFAAPTFAAEANYFIYGGVSLRAIPNDGLKAQMIGFANDVYYLWSANGNRRVNTETWLVDFGNVTSEYVYYYTGTTWVQMENVPTNLLVTPIWSSTGRLSDLNGELVAEYEPAIPLCDGSGCPSTDVNEDNVCDDCGLLFAFPRDYTPEPFTVTKFMNHIGQILTSAVSWVGNVGSTILQQPLLLAFTVLPLYGLGIAVFRRLKETV